MRQVFLVGNHPGFRVALARTIQDQSKQALNVVGHASWGPGTLALISRAQPDVIILVVGFATSSELGVVTEIRRLVPACRVLVIDALGDAAIWPAGGWSQADALLRSDQLATELVPTICRLVAQRGVTQSAVVGTCPPTSPSE
jgi:DNA-binding NarL/FixJ family response regulator